MLTLAPIAVSTAGTLKPPPRSSLSSPQISGEQSDLEFTVLTMSSEDSPTPPKAQTFLIWSQKSPEEVRLFGLRGSDIQEVSAAQEEETPVSPDDWGFTAPTSNAV